MLAVTDEPLPGRDPSRGVVVFDVESQKKIAELSGLRQPITALTFSRDSRRLAAGDRLGAVRVWQRR
jgi:WD40 repeat protein